MNTCTCCNFVLCFGEESIYLIICSDISAGIENHNSNTVPCAPDSCSKACAACHAEGASDN